VTDSLAGRYSASLDLTSQNGLVAVSVVKPMLREVEIHGRIAGAIAALEKLRPYITTPEGKSFHSRAVQEVKLALTERIAKGGVVW
jgi:hypothetical protein